MLNHLSQFTIPKDALKWRSCRLAALDNRLYLTFTVTQPATIASGLRYAHTLAEVLHN